MFKFFIVFPEDNDYVLKYPNYLYSRRKKFSNYLSTILYEGEDLHIRTYVLLYG